MKLTKKAKEGRHTEKEPTRGRLLAEYAKKPVRKVLQIDRWPFAGATGRGGGR